MHMLHEFEASNITAACTAATGADYEHCTARTISQVWIKARSCNANLRYIMLKTHFALQG